MRIVIDLQGAQSNGSRNRGIGRYSLSIAQTIARLRRGHEVFIALNGLFPETVADIRDAFRDLLPQEHIRVWSAPSPVSWGDQDSHSRRVTAELLREAFIASLEPDVVLVSSLMEGLTDDAITSIGLMSTLPTAAILYDLIPLIHADLYLSNPETKAWYHAKLEHLRRADLLLAISESSADEARRYLMVDAERVVNVSTACEAHFRSQASSPPELERLQSDLGLTRPYVMYTGGIDHRKNIEGLIRAYARLPIEVRREHQLALVCSIGTRDRTRLHDLARSAGMADGDLVLTGYVSEPDLVMLYNECTLFVFPSWHEGFGLPALEAMQCGRPVIAAKTSSLPEVIGRPDALFDPHNEHELAELLLKGLTDEAFRTDLIEHGTLQAGKFSWERSANAAIDAMERMHAVRPAPSHDRPAPKKRMAIVTPLPPARSGISDYSAELIPALAEWYEIDVVVAQASVEDAWIKSHCGIRDIEWFAKNHSRYERVIYHFGNSVFHEHMFDLLEAIPGVVVLHDFFLSGILAHRELSGGVQDVWSQALLRSHGAQALGDRKASKDVREVILRYPCNLSVLQNALGIIVHSEYSRTLAREWYGLAASDRWACIPLLRLPAQARNKDQARKRLNLPLQAHVICSFGMIAATKLNHRLLTAFLSSALVTDEDAYLVFVGEAGSDKYSKGLIDQISNSGLASRIRITGWVDRTTYIDFLSAADVGVQLRTQSRGETSAAALDCMNYGLATIVNANGSMSELDCAKVLPDQFSDAELTAALEAFHADPQLMEHAGLRGKRDVSHRHNPTVCAEKYFESVEAFYSNAERGLYGLVNKFGVLGEGTASKRVELAYHLARSFPPCPRPRQLFLLPSSSIDGAPSESAPSVKARSSAELRSKAPPGWIVVDVEFSKENGVLTYSGVATDGTCERTTELETCTMGIDAWHGDLIYIERSELQAHEPSLLECIKRYELYGVRVTHDIRSAFEGG